MSERYPLNIEKLLCFGARIIAIAAVLPFVIFDTVRVFPSLAFSGAVAVSLRIALSLGVAALYWWRPPRLNKGFLLGGRSAAWRDLLFLVFGALVVNGVCESGGWSLSPNQALRFQWASLILAGLFWLIWIDQEGPVRVRLSRSVRKLDLLAFNFIVLLVVLEMLLLAAATFFPNPLLWEERSVLSGIEAFRKSQRPIFGRFTNNQGYHDDEFFPGADDSLVIALLGDSFAFSVVPFSRTFATVAERELQRSLGNSYSRTAIHNLGVPAIGMPHYYYLLVNEVPALNPTLVVLAVFVGNDIGPPWSRQEDAWPARHWKLVTVLERISQLWAGAPNLPPSSPASKPAVRQEVIPDYVDNPELEKPTFSKQVFMKIESSRMEVTNPDLDQTQLAFEEFFRWMERIRRNAGEELLLLLIPDELQVNDGLWQELLSLKAQPDQYDRDYPQTRILAYARQHQIPTLDLLPLLREAPGRVYQLQDTHLNGTGNRIVGRALAELLLERLEQESSQE